MTRPRLLRPLFVRPPLRRGALALFVLALALAAFAAVGPEVPVGTPGVGPHPASQDGAAIAPGPSQSFVVWRDARGGSSNAVYGARIDATGAVLDPHGIRIGTGSTPRVAWDGATTYLVVWTDASNVYGARIRSTDGALLDPSPIAIATGTDEELDPDVAFAGGSYFVVWQQRATATPNFRIVGRRVSPAGAVLDAAVRTVSQLATASYTATQPAIATDGTDFMVAFIGKATQTADVYGARVSSSGAVIGASDLEIFAGLEGQTTTEGNPVIGFDGAQFLVVWDSGGKVGFKWVSPGGVPSAVGYFAMANGKNPSIGCGSLQCAVTWLDFRNTADFEFFGVFTHSDLTIDVEVPLVTVPARKNSPAFAWDGTRFVLAWGDDRTGDGDIYARRYDLTFTPQGPDFRVTRAGAAQRNAAMAAGPGGEVLVVWQEARETGSDLFATRISSAGTPLDAPPLTISSAAGDQVAPAVAFDPGTGTYLVVWEDRRNSTTNPEIFGARVQGASVLDPGGILIAGGATQPRTIPDVAFGGGAFEVVYQDDEYSVGVVRVSTTGVPGAAGRVIDGSSAEWQLSPSIVFGPSANKFFVAWSYDTQGVYQLWGKFLSASGAPEAIVHTLDSDFAWGPNRTFAVGSFFGALHTNNGKLSSELIDLNGVSAGELVVQLTGSAFEFDMVQNGTQSAAVWVAGTDLLIRRFNSAGTAIDPSPIALSKNVAIYRPVVAPTSADRYVVGYSRAEPAAPYSSADGAFYRSVDLSSGADTTPPLAGTVSDGTAADVDTQSTRASLSATWTGFSDPESNVAGYEWAIGTTPGGTDIQPFTAVGTGTSASASPSLQNGARYYVSVRATNGSGLTVTATSDGVLVDDTAPARGTVTDGTGPDLDLQASADTLAASWTAFSDPDSGIPGYEWAIGTTANGTDVQDFESVGTSTTASATGLALATGTTYFVTVRATNGVGLTSTATSDGVRVDATGPVLSLVNDGPGADIDSTFSLTALEASWAAADSESGVVGYEWAIGTTPGGTEVQPFTPVGLATSAQASGLSLQNAQQYFVTVRATNGVGLTSTRTSDGVTAVRPFASVRFVVVPSTSSAGAPFTVTIEVLDGLGNRATGYAGWLRFESSDPLATLPARHQMEALEGGVHDFDFTLWTTGNQTVVVLDEDDPSIAGTAVIAVTTPVAPVIQRSANLTGAIGVAYRYNAEGRIRAAGNAPIAYAKCGGPVELAVDAVTGAVSWIPVASGPQTLCVQASNADGVDTYSFTVDVALAPGAAPIAALAASVSSGPAPLSLSLDATASVGDGPLTYRWELGDGSAAPSGARVTHVYRLPGTYRPRVEVFDRYGQRSETFATVEVTNAQGQRPPAGWIIASATTGQDSLTVDFSCDCHPGSAAITGYRWESTDGATSAAPTFQRTFGPGRHTVVLTVVDQNGLGSSDRVEISVTAGALSPPLCRASALPAAAVAPYDVAYSGAAAPGSAAIASMRWLFDDGATADGANATRNVTAPGETWARFEVVDAQGLSCRDLAKTVALASTGRAPLILAGAPAEARCGEPYAVGAPIAALGDHPLTWSLATAPEGATVDASTGAIAWTPHRDQAGPQRLELRAENPSGADVAVLEVPVTCVARPMLGVGCGCSTGASAPGATWALWASLGVLALSRRRARPGRGV